MIRTLFIILLAGLLTACSSHSGPYKIYVDQATDQTRFAISNLPVLFDGLEFESCPTRSEADLIVLTSEPGENSSIQEGYRLSPSDEYPSALQITGMGKNGAMYGILDVAEHLSFGMQLDEIESKVVHPSQKHRIIKYNLPWSSYRKGKTLSLHMETCRDTLYWESFLNMMVVNRFNTLSLWNMHPYTYMIRPDKYPEASPFSEEEMAEWKSFWNSLFRMARERGIKTFIVNWNIFTSREFAEAHDLGENLVSGDFFGDASNSELIEDYTRECVRQVIDEYPDLSGIGLTLGERMGGMTAEERRDWADRTIIAGMRQAHRKAELLYRAPLSAGKGSHGTTSKSTETITRAYLDTLTASSETIISFKYNWSHGHSSDRLFMVHGGKLTDTYWNPVPENYSVLWTVRNEDFFTHRWAQPDFIRSFLENNMADYTSGCIIGSECYIPARDYFSKDMENKPFKYAFERQWLFYSAWGRILYDQSTSDELFANQLNRKFGISYGADLLVSWKRASDYYHLFNSFYKGTWDATNYAEAFTSLKRVPGKPDQSTIVTMDLLGTRPVLDTSRFINIADYVQSGYEEPDGLITPPMLAELLTRNGTSILSDLEDFGKKGEPALELDMELTDLEILARLQLFFAQRIDATLLLADHLLLGEALHQDQIEDYLLASIGQWEAIIQLKEKYNLKTIPYMFNENLNYTSYLEVLEEELRTFPEMEGFFDHILN